ncbi:2-methoxy-6-polyprenyl-1,4-benzoquinol methylase, mitochondrial [Phlebotomus argentipes]|uniref:2-methoxy-6-polyprenyl-1,4-benzoquinol methylase, mitochondrial n=1 Tax=Phlebotomus argentipes TaxID=94469 RepID=UPI002892BE21|nr:2-methoxy-6-polyprenyl-1,4-benzoquinol methylase, mitochondrial [Phlebotomus argentipes]
MLSKTRLLARNSYGSVVSLSARHIRSQIPTVLQSKDSTDGEEKGENLTHFGFQTVSEDEKADKVYKVFEDVAQSYDMMNDVMSMGIQRLWKDAFIEDLAPTPGTKLLDMAGGTGDIAFRFLKYLANIRDPEKRQSHLTIADINQHMLDVGKTRAERLAYKDAAHCTIDWVCADAENLHFDANTFTAYTIAFGVRNCTHIDKVLSEAYRVLVPGGRFLCLELSQPSNETLRKLYDKYSFEVIPPMGQILAGQWQPYQYLVESIRRFPRQDHFAEMIRAAGFSQVRHRDLTFGVCSIHSGFKLK